jgi:tetratricopeptide (TPR) repeat protein
VTRRLSRCLTALFLIGVTRSQAARASEGPAPLTIDYPLNESVFPPGFPPPTFLWHDSAGAATRWRIDVSLAGGCQLPSVFTQGDAPAPTPEAARQDLPEAARNYRPAPYLASAKRWQPDGGLWAAVQRDCVQGPATVTMVGLERDRPVSRGVVAIRTSADPVGAPIFYRDLPLPFIHAFRNCHLIRWRLGDVTSGAPPPTLLKDMKVCGNCHSFTPDGKTLAMDVDYGNDKGSYVITAVSRETVLSKEKIITWTDYRREDKELTFGLLSQISPDGRYAISTVKDRSVFSPVNDLYYSQRFFPVKGILVVYDRETRKFFPLPGADDPRYVQSNPTWSPDGATVLFARNDAHELKHLKDPTAAVITPEEVREFFEGGRKFCYDLYRVPFNGGRGGKAEPLAGAAGNGRSNYFPKSSPDGKWIVFCQAETFMLLQPDSLLYIMPAQGGEPRKMRCNLPGKMNSWHSWSPNGRWLVFASKANGPYTQLWLTHVDAQGNDAPPVLLERFTAPDRAANIPEFVNVEPDRFATIREEFADYYTHFRIGLEHERYFEHAAAVEELRKVLAEKPDHLDAIYLIASCLARMGREAEAISHARKVLALSPDHAAAHRLLGGLLSRTGQFKEAVAHLERVLKARPEDLVTGNNLAWVLATCPDATYRDGPRAVELAERVCKATNHSVPVMLDSLAAAYAEAGRFPSAVEAARRALAMVRRDPKAPTRELEARLKLYEMGKPYRQPIAAP